VTTHEALWRQLRQLVLTDFDSRKAAAAALDLSFLRVKALIELSHEPRTMRELAVRLAIDAPHATVIVDELERKGLVRRQPHPTDRRSKVAVLTAAGRRAAAKADKVLNTPPAAFRQLDDRALAALAKAVDQVQRNASTATGDR
jgi:DNA-binding MarR family transcriptional regulator